MGIEKTSSHEENSEATESLQVSSEPSPGNQPCQHDGDCRPGEKCIDGACVGQ
jgi:hypothetical protein